MSIIHGVCTFVNVCVKRFKSYLHLNRDMKRLVVHNVCCNIHHTGFEGAKFSKLWKELNDITGGSIF